MTPGKRFEADIQKSIPTNIFYYRINDSTGKFSGGTELRFSNLQPCDSFLFDTQKKRLYALELKSTKGSFFSFERIDEDVNYKKMIHKHQILSLLDFATYENICCGFLFNFRKKDGTEKTYFQEIHHFINMINTIDKTSFNEKDLLQHHPIEIEGKKLRKYYRWNIDKFLKIEK